MIAAWLGAGAWLLFTAGALAITVPRQRLGPAPVAVVLTLGVLAAVNLRAARGARAALLRRRDELR